MKTNGMHPQVLAAVTAATTACPGIKPEQVLEKCRLHEVVVCRALAVKALADVEFNDRRIAEAFGCHRTAIRHLRMNVEVDSGLLKKVIAAVVKAAAK